MVLDYAGDNELTRVNIYKMASGIVLVSTAGKVAAWIGSLVTNYSEKELLKGMFEKGYAALEVFTDPYHIYSQDLVEALVDGNFVGPVSN